jgi:hypothetical protein
MDPAPVKMRRGLSELKFLEGVVWTEWKIFEKKERFK